MIFTCQALILLRHDLVSICHLSWYFSAQRRLYGFMFYCHNYRPNIRLTPLNSSISYNYHFFKWQPTDISEILFHRKHRCSAFLFLLWTAREPRISHRYCIYFLNKLNTLYLIIIFFRTHRCSAFLPPTATGRVSYRFPVVARLSYGSRTRQRKRAFIDMWDAHIGHRTNEGKWKKKEKDQMMHAETVL